MDKEEVRKLSEELGELSENEKKNIERMKEIAHILTNYYMRWTDVENAEKKSAKKTSDVKTAES